MRKLRRATILPQPQAESGGRAHHKEGVKNRVVAARRRGNPPTGGWLRQGGHKGRPYSAFFHTFKPTSLPPPKKIVDAIFDKYRGRAR
jgi:hypothetical protein